MGILGAAFGIAKVAGGIGMAAAKKVYRAEAQIGRATAFVGKEFAAAPNFANPLSFANGVAQNFVKGVVKETPSSIIKNGKGEFVEKASHYSLTGKGASILGVGMAAYGVSDSMNILQESRQGTASGEMMTSTPMIDMGGMVDNGGATGDLVFAMNRNRRG